MVSSDEIEREEARPRGILGPPDRKWLLMDREEFEEEHTPQYWGQRRDKVAERVRHGILDFTLLFEHLDASDRDRMFARENSWLEYGPEFEAALEDTIAFIFCAVTRDLSFEIPSGAPGYPGLSGGGSGPHSGGFLYILGAALEKAYLEHDILYEGGELLIEGTQVPQLSTVKKKLERGETLHPKMAALLVQSGAIDNERLTELAREELLEDGPADEEE